MNKEHSNSKASLLMVASMAFFAVEDVFIKMLSQRFSVGHLMLIVGLGAGTLMWLQLRRQGHRLLTPALWHPWVLLRSFGEIVGSLGFVLAITRSEISLVTALFQATPLVIVVGAFLFLRERLTLAKVVSVALGLAGVLIILRPGSAAFDPQALFALLAIAGLAIRDLSTRKIPSSIPSHQISTLAFFMIALSGLGYILLTGTALLVSAEEIHFLYMALSVLCATSGYAALVAAMRLGEVSVVVSFRYSRLIFALLLGTLVFGERPDLWTYVGALVVVAAGIFVLWSESEALRRGRRPLRVVLRPG